MEETINKTDSDAVTAPEVPLTDDDIQNPQEAPFVEKNQKEAECLILDDFSEPICAVCEIGGEMICCDGRCLRSFHPVYHTISLTI